MVSLQIDESLAAKLETLAQAEGQSVQDLLENMADNYRSKPTAPAKTPEQRAADLEAIAGIFDDDIHDLSETVLH